MAYTLPSFNLIANLYDSGQPIGGGNPWRVQAVASKVPGKRTFVPYGAVGPFTDALFVVYLLMPKYTDVRGPLSPGGADGIECDDGTGHFYRVLFIENVAEQHPNWHLLVACQQLPPYPQPFNDVP